jgi:hypothetical protein
MIAFWLPNKPLQMMWSPLGHRVESRRRLGGAHTAERQSVRQTAILRRRGHFTCGEDGIACWVLSASDCR